MRDLQMTGKKHGFFHEIFKNRILYLMVLPAVLYFILFSYIPMLGILFAFKNYNYADGILRSPWVGFDNFRFLFVSGTFTTITTNTILYNVAFLVVGLILQVGTALLLNEIASKVFKKLAQTMMFLPYFVSYVILAAFVYNIFNYDSGLLNNILVSLGLPKFSAYTTPKVWKYIILFFNQWKGLGYGVVVYLAVITGIGQEYYESAKIDGANHWQQIRYITMPMLKPTVIIMTMFGIGKIMKGQFELFYQIIGDNGVLFNATDIIDTFVFRTMTQTFNIGMGTAAGFYQSMFGLILILTVNWITKKINPDYALF